MDDDDDDDDDGLFYASLWAYAVVLCHVKRLMNEALVTAPQRRFFKASNFKNYNFKADQTQIFYIFS